MVRPDIWKKVHIVVLQRGGIEYRSLVMSWPSCRAKFKESSSWSVFRQISSRRYRIFVFCLLSIRRPLRAFKRGFDLQTKQYIAQIRRTTLTSPLIIAFRLAGIQRVSWDLETSDSAFDKHYSVPDWLSVNVSSEQTASFTTSHRQSQPTTTENHQKNFTIRILRATTQRCNNDEGTRMEIGRIQGCLSTFTTKLLHFIIL
jgi:hypothetical protein